LLFELVFCYSVRMLIDDKALDHLFSLARIGNEISPSRREKLKKDLSGILDYFNELKQVDTHDAPPLFGGTFLLNVVREDNAVRDDKEVRQQKEVAVQQFPKSEVGCLKVPPVFE